MASDLIAIGASGLIAIIQALGFFILHSIRADIRDVRRDQIAMTARIGQIEGKIERRATIARRAESA